MIKKTLDFSIYLPSCRSTDGSLVRKKRVTSGSGRWLVGAVSFLPRKFKLHVNEVATKLQNLGFADENVVTLLEVNFNRWLCICC